MQPGERNAGGTARGPRRPPSARGSPRQAPACPPARRCPATHAAHRPLPSPPAPAPAPPLLPRQPHAHPRRRWAAPPACRSAASGSRRCCCPACACPQWPPPRPAGRGDAPHARRALKAGHPRLLPATSDAAEQAAAGTVHATLPPNRQSAPLYRCSTAVLPHLNVCGHEVEVLVPLGALELAVRVLRYRGSSRTAWIELNQQHCGSPRAPTCAARSPRAAARPPLVLLASLAAVQCSGWHRLLTTQHPGDNPAPRLGGNPAPTEYSTLEA